MAQTHSLPGLLILDWGASELPPGCHIAMSTRRGGVSPPPYDSLNVSYAVGDDPVSVTRNRGILAAALRLPLSAVTFAAQAHGLRVQDVGEMERGRGHASLGDAFAGTDGLLTEQVATPLAILTADCYPIAVMGDGAIAIAHAGWRGTLGNLAGRCVAELVRRGQPAGEMTGYLGPGIRDCCYTVDEGRAAAFVERYGEESGVCSRSPKGMMLDLAMANRLNLQAAGLQAHRIFSQGDCTACNPEYFSYRRDGLTGRQAMVIWMSGDAG